MKIRLRHVLRHDFAVVCEGRPHHRKLLGSTSPSAAHDAYLASSHTLSSCQPGPDGQSPTQFTDRLWSLHTAQPLREGHATSRKLSIADRQRRLDVWRTVPYYRLSKRSASPDCGRQFCTGKCFCSRSLGTVVPSMLCGSRRRQSRLVPLTDLFTA